MSRSFTEPAFSRTATYRVKQLTTSTQNTFPFQNCHSCFGWKNTMSSAQIGGLLLLPLRLPRPWAPPTDTSPSSRCFYISENLCIFVYLGEGSWGFTYNYCISCDIFAFTLKKRLCTEAAILNLKRWLGAGSTYMEQMGRPCSLWKIPICLFSAK